MIVSRNENRVIYFFFFGVGYKFTTVLQGKKQKTSDVMQPLVLKKIPDYLIPFSFLHFYFLEIMEIFIIFILSSETKLAK